MHSRKADDQCDLFPNGKEAKLQNKDILIEKQEKDIERFQSALNNKTHSYELLTGKYQRLMEVYDAIGGNISYFLKN